MQGWKYGWMGAWVTGLWILAASGVDAQRVVTIETLADGAYRLMVDGEPFVVKGAGAIHRLEELASAGANSVRTWGVGDDTQELLDRAHALGMTVTLGLWLEHEGKDGFSYRDADAVAKQLASARASVRRFKDHPALLFWGVGNEMELASGGKDRAMWQAVNEVARMVQLEDPNHPTMCVVAEIGDPAGEKVWHMKELCPDVQVWGINSYGGAASLGRRVRLAGLGRPMVLTEYGAHNAFELAKTPWGVAIEQTSTQRARSVLESYRAVVDGHADVCLGSYWFYWGGQEKETAGWHSAFVSSGERLGTVDAVTALWSGRWPANLVPMLEGVLTDAQVNGLKPGEVFEARALAFDVDNDALSYRWELRAERADPATWGDHEPAAPPALEGAVVLRDSGVVTVTAPRMAGAYRLYVVVTDGMGGAAAGNVALRVVE